MKKILAIVLSALMLMSIMPVAFAADEECKHRFDNFLGERPNVRDDGYCYCSLCGVKSADFSGVVEAFVRGTAILFSVYDADAGLERDYLQGVLRRITDELYFFEEDNYFTIAYATEEEQDEIDFRVNNAKKVLDDFKNENYAVVYDATELATKYMSVYFQVQWYTGGERAFFGDYLNVVRAAMNDYENIVYSVESGLIEADYEVCAKEATKVMNCFDRQISCLEGNHTFGEYTENADGSKTANCTCCVATDTIEAEKKDIMDIVSTDLVELIKMLIAIVKSFVEAVILK